jgi:hypothetical protein
MFAILATSCRSTKTAIEKETVQTRQELDSVSEKVTFETRLLTTPRATAKLNLSLEQLQDLPVGGKYQAKDGNATGTIEKKPDGSLEFTANCDSLTLLVESLTKEVYRYKNENAELKTNTKEEKVVEVNRLSGWQWFQIYGFRIYFSLTLLLVGYRLIKNNLKIG